MDVTLNNLKEAMDDIDQILPTSSFVAIDAEMTGLVIDQPDAFSTPIKYYQRMREGAAAFMMVQFGLSIFSFDTKLAEYISSTYNFYVFPREIFSRLSPNRMFSCQSSSMTFLAKAGFNFNKLFAEGIPFTTVAESEKLKEELTARRKAKECIEPLPESVLEPDVMEDFCTRIKKFLESGDKELVIEKCSVLQKRAIEVEVQNRWPGLMRLEMKQEDTRRFLLVSLKGTPEEEAKLLADAIAEEEIELMKAQGLSLVMQKISKCGKPVIGHNMLLDLCHIIDKCYGELPEDYDDFKDMVHSVFPSLIDTKMLAVAQSLGETNTALEVLFKSLSQSHYIPPARTVPGREYPFGEIRMHEAGFDAYITGLTFLGLLTKDRYSRTGFLMTDPEMLNIPKSPLLQDNINKLVMHRIRDYRYVDIIGNDPHPSRDHLIHLSITKKWGTYEILSLIQHFGGGFVSWVNSTSAIIDANKRDNIPAIVEYLDSRDDVTVSSYKNHEPEFYKIVERDNELMKTNFIAKVINKKQKKNDEKEEKPPTQKQPRSEESDWEVAAGNKNNLFDNSSTFSAKKTIAKFNSESTRVEQTNGKSIQRSENDEPYKKEKFPYTRNIKKDVRSNRFSWKSKNYEQLLKQNKSHSADSVENPNVPPSKSMNASKDCCLDYNKYDLYSKENIVNFKPDDRRISVDGMHTESNKTSPKKDDKIRKRFGPVLTDGENKCAKVEQVSKSSKKKSESKTGLYWYLMAQIAGILFLLYVFGSAYGHIIP